ncbi:MAG: phosphatase PAP2 family protein [Neisseriaceae bacterium]|nr:MAG: phosphatase PAP2 family protein [Neisseriaceae bacterium]
MSNSLGKNNMIYSDLSHLRKPKKHFYNWGIFAGFLVLALGIWLGGINHSLFLEINHQHGLLPNILWGGLNLLSYSKFFILPVLLIILTFAFKRERILNVLLLVLAYYVVFAALKVAVGEARPYIVLPEGSFFWLNYFEDAVKSAHKSFPSGHTGNMAVFVFAISNLFFVNRKGLQFIMLLLLILTAFARICTGWHWPLDVIASGLIGYLLVKVCFAINFKRLTGKRG